MQNAKTFTLGDKKLHLLFLTKVGSTLHKLNLSNSDLDLKGVFLWDKDLTLGLNPPQDTLDSKNTNRFQWANLMEQLNQEFNLNLELDDDLDLFEARKFFNTALKNDFNMFDMLFSDLTPVFSTNSFKEVLNNKKSFLNMKFAKSRFQGMSKTSLNDAKKLNKKENKTNKQNNLFFKTMAKSLQFLFSLENLLLEQTFNPVLKENQRLEVLEVKKGLKSFEEVEKRFNFLDENLKSLFENEDLMKKNSDLLLVNNLLVDLTNNTFSNLT